MGEINYAPVIREMTWSYSRVKAFLDCPHRWYLRYIRRLPGKALFFSSYGSFVHELLARFYSGRASPGELAERYLLSFHERVASPAPSPPVFQSYFRAGLSHLRGLSAPPFSPLAVEKHIRFPVGGVSSRGVLDLLAREGGGALLLIDHKSHVFRGLSGGKPPAPAARAEFSSYLRQLYLYSAAVHKEYGAFPDQLCFNCFRDGSFLREPFCREAYDEAIDWFSSSVSAILSESDFPPDLDFFKCRHLCEMQEHCEYYEMNWR